MSLQGFLLGPKTGKKCFWGDENSSWAQPLLTFMKMQQGRISTSADFLCSCRPLLTLTYILLTLILAPPAGDSILLRGKHDFQAPAGVLLEQEQRFF